LVWTVHNVLPHQPVFADDIRARRQLVGACDLVLAHSQSALAELAELGITPRRTAVIPIGPFAPPPSAEPLRAPGTHEGSRRLLFFGRVEEYKGVEDLLAAFATIPADLPVSLMVAGECGDQGLRSRLRALAKQPGNRVALHLERVAEAEVTLLLSDADVVVLPFRRITTSASAILALCHRRPLVVPDLAAFADLPEEAVVRYDGTVQGLAAAIVRISLADASVLAAMSAAAGEYSSAISWREIAERTMEKLAQILTGGPNVGTDSQPTGIT
jgi:glycosyltransferase involved in cell wall biosynthesis